MTDTTDFSNYPKSITEIKGEKTQDGSKWAVRDALISVLRDLDSGQINPDQIIIIVGEIHPDGVTKTNFYNRTDNRYVFQGLLIDVFQRLTVAEAGGEF